MGGAKTSITHWSVNTHFDIHYPPSTSPQVRGGGVLKDFYDIPSSSPTLEECVRETC